MKKGVWKHGDLLLPILVFFSEYCSRHSQRQQESRLCRCCDRQVNCSDSENAVTFGAAKSQVGEGGEGGGESDLNVQLTSSREQVNMSTIPNVSHAWNNWRMKYTNANFSCKKNCGVGNIIKRPAQAFNSAYIEFWRTLKSLKTTQESRGTFGCATSNFYASSALSVLTSRVLAL